MGLSSKTGGNLHGLGQTGRAETRETAIAALPKMLGACNDAIFSALRNALSGLFAGELTAELSTHEETSPAPNFTELYTLRITSALQDHSSGAALLFPLLVCALP